MQRFKRISTSMAAIFMALSFTVAVPVYAEGGSGTSGSGSTSGADDSTSSTTGVTPEQEHNTINNSGNPEVKRGGTREDRLKREQELADKKAEAKEKKESRVSENKLKKCEAHKQGLTTKFSRITTNSERIKSRIDDIFSKAQQYQTTNNITVDNSLVTSATTAQQAAADAIANLKTVTPSIDCNNVSVASDVANFKVAAVKTRDALKDYRTAVKNYLKALKDAKETSSTTAGTTGGSND